MDQDLKIEISRNRKRFSIHYTFYLESSDKNPIGGRVNAGEEATGERHLLRICRDICYSHVEYNIELINSETSPIKKNLFNRLNKRVKSFKKL